MYHGSRCTGICCFNCGIFKCVHMHLLIDVSLIWYTECGGYVEVRNLGYGETGSIGLLWDLNSPRDCAS